MALLILTLVSCGMAAEPIASGGSVPETTTQVSANTYSSFWSDSAIPITDNNRADLNCRSTKVMKEQQTFRKVQL
jgi:hypothetical protein